MQFSSLLFFSVSTPPSRKRQGGVKRVPQALQACILTSSSYSSPITPIPNTLVPRPQYLLTLRSYPHKRCCRGHRRLSDTVPMSTHPSPLSARQQARDRSRVVDTAAAAVPEVQLLWVTPCSASETLSVGHRGRTNISSFGDARLWSHRRTPIYIPWIPTFTITTVGDYCQQIFHTFVNYCDTLFLNGVFFLSISL